MRRVLALVSGTGWHVQDLARAADGLGIAFEPIPFPQITARIDADGARVSAGRIPISQDDSVLLRMMPPGSLEQVVFRMDALHRLAASGVPVLNPPGAIEASVDKYLALARIEACGLDVPPTWVGESSRDALAAFATLGGEVVVKPLFGSEGRGLSRVSDPEVGRRVFQALERVGSVLYLQKYIPNLGHDLRIFVLGNRVIGAIRRHVPEGDWRANISVGGRAEAVRVGDEVSGLALRAARAVGAHMAGVDILPAADGSLYVLEVNAVPGWRALGAATGVDVASEILDELRGFGR